MCAECHVGQVTEVLRGEVSVSAVEQQRRRALHLVVTHGAGSGVFSASRQVDTHRKLDAVLVQEGT